ncbi:MAG: hypothetical protein ACE5HE_09380, partial [Phycisphaerae bacterium]
MQFYTDTHQDLVDTTLLAFRIAEDARIHLPAMVAMDGFVTSHTLMGAELPEQELVDRYLPPCQIRHQLSKERPTTVGGLTWPRETEHHRVEIEEALKQVPAVLDEALNAFEEVFGRRPHGAVAAELTDDADIVLVACNTIAPTVRRVLATRREKGQRIGMVKSKMFRPFPREEMARAIGSAKKVGVLDRNHSPGSGGIFWQEVALSLRQRSDVMVQDYLVGLGGGDVTPRFIEEIIDDLDARREVTEPIWKEVAA